MANVSIKTELPVPAEAVWSVIGGFNAMPDWHPAVEKSEEVKEGNTKTRKLSIVGGGTIVERLERVNAQERSYSYTIHQAGPLPVADYTGTIRVLDSAGGIGCTIEWSSEFTPSGVPENDATAAIRGIYEAGFENLRKMFGA